MGNYLQIVQLIQQAIPLFSDTWKKENGLFFHTEHLHRFVSYSYNGLLNGFPEYGLTSGFKTKIPIESKVVQDLKTCYQTIEASNFSSTLTHKKQLQTCLENLPFSVVLLLMGQRLSSTSITDNTALPPLEEELLQACFKPFNTQMSMAVRAWEKHAERSDHQFWPPRKGNAQYKENMMKDFIHQFLKDWEWWNVYSHQKHDYVFELRVPSGHGMRWSVNGKQFIGFLEPFIEVV